MNIARPASGFLISEPASFAAYLAGFTNRWPRVLRHWDGVKDRLKMTAHREGQAVGHILHRVFEALGSSDGQFPTIRVAYFVFADTLTFIAIVVIEPEAD
jgi:hypothetical protein